MSNDELRDRAIADLPDCPVSVLQYIRHIGSNKTLAVTGNLELANCTESISRMLDSVAKAGLAANELWDELDFLTKGAGL
jgi:hypothetical protein